MCESKKNGGECRNGCGGGSDEAYRCVHSDARGLRRHASRSFRARTLRGRQSKKLERTSRKPWKWCWRPTVNSPKKSLGSGRHERAVRTGTMKLHDLIRHLSRMAVTARDRGKHTVYVNPGESPGLGCSAASGNQRFPRGKSAGTGHFGTMKPERIQPSVLIPAAGLCPSLIQESRQDSSPSGSLQRLRVGLDLPHGRGDLVHVAARSQEHGLDEPDGLLAEPVVGRAVVPFFPAVEDFAWERASGIPSS